VTIKAFTKDHSENRTQPEETIRKGAFTHRTDVVPSWCHKKCTPVNVRDIPIFYLLVTFVVFTDIHVSIPTIVFYIHIQSYV